MIIVPNCFFGLGDIIWCQTLVRKIAGDNKIKWPVISHFLDGLRVAYPDIEWVDYKDKLIDHERRDDYIIDDLRVLPLRWGVENMKVPYKDCMRAKYDMYNLDWHSWKEHADFDIDLNKCANLVKALAQQENGVIKPFNFVNTTFRSDFSGKVNIQSVNGLPNIEMRPIPGYSMFDWVWLLSQAETIHTVSTSLIYIIELLPLLKCKEIHIYLRKPDEKNHDNYKYILNSHNYIYH